MTTTQQPGGYFRLDPIVGWRADKTEFLALDSTGISVDCLPGQPQAFATLLADQFSYPIALASGNGRRNLYVLDDGFHRVKVVDLKLLREANTISGFGGKGRGARQFRGARGLAVLPDGAIVIADAGNHQVKIFSSYPNALLAVWGSGQPGKALKEFHSPWKVVADRCGLIHVADRKNGRIQRIHRDGISEEPITGLQSPSGLALGADGTLAILDGSNVLTYAAGQTTPAQTLPVPAASCITLDAGGYLYVGTTTALVYKFAPLSEGSFQFVGIGVTGKSAQFVDLLWTQKNQLLALMLAPCEPAPHLWSLETCAAFLDFGTLITETLDSGIEGCIWNRIALDASVPSGTVLEVATQTAETDIWSNGGAFTPECTAISPVSSDCPLSLTGDNPDCLVQSLPGRYLRAQIKLKTNGITSPELQAVRVYFPRQSYLQYLPAIYQEDDESRVFLDKFLSIFQSTFDGMDQQVDNMWMMFDPKSVPSGWFPWLAAWLALPINPVWTDQQRRTALKNAGKLYPLRGTQAGIEQLIKEYANIDARLVEHFQLRQLLILSDQPAGATTSGTGSRLWGRDYYQRLQIGVYSRVGYFRLTGEPEPGIEALAWGANEFSVFFDCDPYQVSAARLALEPVVEREKPAHTKANYVPVFPRMRLGMQSTLGVDTRIGEFTPLLLGTTGILDYDSILACSKTENQLRGQHSTSYLPQVDVSSRLL